MKRVKNRITYEWQKYMRRIVSRLQKKYNNPTERLFIYFQKLAGGVKFIILAFNKFKFLNFEISNSKIQKTKDFLDKFIKPKTVIILSIFISITSILYFYFRNQIVIYGDAESHLNIAKRIVDSITPGMGQLGGVWLPLPHVLMIPFVYSDFLWRSGLGGSIVSGGAFVISCIFIYRIIFLLTQNKYASFFGFIIFATNPNVLYLSSTPMTEPLLIATFMTSSFYFIKFMKNQSDLFALILAAIFGFLSTLTRYEGWFLVAFEALILILFHLQSRKMLKKLEGKLVLFGTLAFFGIFLWLLWDYFILGDAFYFTNSPFSAKSQQNSWARRGELPAHNNLFLSIAYYLVTSMSNVGVFIFAVTLISLFVFLKRDKNGENYLEKIYVAILVLMPAFFYVLTLYVGQSVIFIPHLTPVSFEWRLFNVRYGLMMVPAAAIFVSLLFWKRKTLGKSLILLFFILQFGLYIVGYSKIITLEDGTVGLSHAKRPDAESWFAKHYDSGLVLIDDYARTMSIIRSGVPMQNIIYIGNRFYWEDSLRNPDKWATWVIMQRGDAIWTKIYEDPVVRARLYAHFQKEYTSKEILIFKKNK